MIYLEYHKQTKQVVEIHTDEPNASNDFDYAISDSFIVGDEFELTIWVNEVDENKYLLSYSAIRNNPNAQRLLRENVELKQETIAIRIQSAQSNAELFEMMLMMIGGGLA